MHCRDEYQDELDRRAIVRRLDEVTRMLCAVMTGWSTALLLWLEIDKNGHTVIKEFNP